MEGEILYRQFMDLSSLKNMYVFDLYDN